MMRVLVVDDEPLARRGVIKRLSQHADIELAGEADNGPAALKSIQALKPDVVFLDIQMPGTNGLDVIRAMKPADRPLVIFLSAYGQFALNAFEVYAIDYLLKPIDDDRFAEALQRARDVRMSRRGVGQGTHSLDVDTPRFPVRFSVRSGQKDVVIAVDEVMWIEAMGDYAGLHAQGRVHLLRETVHRLMEQLDPAQFVRIHRSTIVRLDCIAEIQVLTNRDSLLRLSDGTPLRVSRTYSEALRRALFERGSRET
ncbi:LytR/AlgR family response regulator transcription factor [Dyella psychrodurans]|uniref:DNA-binding response regulator n=1 Tax=Dyella psychrodurans TaxID=1927960 RepID=A0A370XD64_9GAMM|nr:LytTR family DNA-binding domain-containing protein [Dyella psychrodurans]RDS86161.1 DNA-binding response regulator [Dyella psychrodurans]